MENQCTHVLAGLDGCYLAEHGESTLFLCITPYDIASSMESCNQEQIAPYFQPVPEINLKLRGTWRRGFLVTH